MSTFGVQGVEKEFVFQFNNGSGYKATLNAPIISPTSVSSQEFAGRLIKAHNIPYYVEDDLKDAIEEFTNNETKNFFDDLSEDALAKLQNETTDKLAERWAKAFQQEHNAYAKPEELTNETVFSEVYHRMIHSPAMETLLNLEHTYAMSVKELISKRDKALNSLEKKQSEQMEQAVHHLTDDDVNNLAVQHFEQLQLLESQWASELSALHDIQKREYRQWIMTVHEDYQLTVGSPTTEQRLRAFTVAAGPALGEEERTPQVSRMEESFTIHLGAQMKTMHNLRLLSADVMDLCRHKLHKIGGMVVPQPQRLQTAISLYSHNLWGLVLLVDNRPNTYTGIKREFLSVCQQSTEFHFPELEQQFEVIRENALKANEWRTQTNEDGVSMVSSNSSGEQTDRQSNLQVGDFYITRHSNLSEVHVVFHMVVDDSLRSSEISSRHPCILGLRNVLKTACRHDITTVTIPLLLVHEMSEEMTIPWCLKRAELIFKCIKGFMMEMASWGGNDSRTVQFLVPKGISESLFSQLCSMLPSIFRVSTPLVLKSSS